MIQRKWDLVIRRIDDDYIYIWSDLTKEQLKHIEDVDTVLETTGVFSRIFTDCRYDLDSVIQEIIKLAKVEEERVLID